MARKDTYAPQARQGHRRPTDGKGNDLDRVLLRRVRFPRVACRTTRAVLGILSGDHCKSASDLDLNFCAVGLLYRHGYFKQQINKEGWQDAVQLNQNFYNLPVQEIPDAEHDGAPLKIAVELPGRQVHAKVWKLAVGRINLYLLDTDIPENNTEDRAITAQLYGGDLEMRIRQEIVLGMGGPRALAALGLKPSVYHMNEGHAAFLGLERIRHFVRAHQLDFRSALQIVAGSGIFTTHTPVPAGNDAFSPELIAHYFSDYPAQVGVDFEYFFSLGQTTVNKTNDFSMTILALRTSRQANGVSKLHGEVSKGLWKDVWAGVPEDEVPITSITNGIHTKTWVAPEFMELYARYLGADWEENLTNVDYWLRVNRIPDDVLWDTHQKLKARLIDFTRDRVRRQRARLGESPAQLRQVNQILNPEILTIGFARRFATYKRGSLLFKDPERLLKLLNDSERPVQFVFAGKAHPKDDGGKKVIQEVYKHTRSDEFANRVVFIEDYDAYIGRRLYQGVDVWLNNPLRPLEASGTSGMKLPPSGGLNLSVLDGWWCESYNGKNGWAIGSEILEGSVEFQNEVDIESLFHILENADRPAVLRQARREAAYRLAAAHARIHAQRDPGLQHASHGQGVSGASVRHRREGPPRAGRRFRQSRRRAQRMEEQDAPRMVSNSHPRRAARTRRPHPDSGWRQAGVERDRRSRRGGAGRGQGSGVLRREPRKRHRATHDSHAHGVRKDRPRGQLQVHG